MPFNNIILGDAAAIDPNQELYFSDVKFLMNGTGKNNGDTTFTDVIGHVITGNGGLAYSNEQPIFGLNTIKFDGVDDFLSIASAGTDFAPGTLNWTLDQWIYMTAYAPSISSGIGFGTINGSQNGWALNLGQTEPTTRVTSNASGGWADNLACGAGKGISLGAWTLISAERNGDKLHLYKNGNLSATLTGVAAFNFSGTNGFIGKFFDGQYTRFMTGYIGPTRFTRNRARYGGSSFPIPTQKFAES